MAIISLTGFMGCGKSCVGRILAQRLGCSFHDLDSIIEKSSGRSIPEIFASDGEGAFRMMELAALREFVQGQGGGDGLAGISSVLSLGGGTLTTPECVSIVRNHTVCIYLKASEDTLVRNLSCTQIEGRPMLDGAKDEAALRERIRSLMEKRSGIYEAAGTHIVAVDNLSPEAVAEAVFNILL